MYECPNCGGNLKFEIYSQKLFCAYCDTKLEPEAVTKETDTLENDCFEVNVFICPQCGGRMISGDNDATAFCSYCGAANILSTRISQEKRPKYIIPFKRSKEDCKRAYEKRVRQAIFAPKELRDPKFIDSFRGIYMPYWLYHFTQKGKVAFKGQTYTKERHYRCTDFFTLFGDLDAEIQGLSHDASSSFYDLLSQELAPYDTEALKCFTPSYLSGFYADVPDVNPETYLETAKEAINTDTFQRICEEPLFKKHNIRKDVPPDNLSEIMHTKCMSMDSAMYPVWFLSYRNKDRVAYAAVNGQTGKVAMDLPVDPKRYLGFSLLLAVPIFVLLNLFVTLRPPTLLAICCIVAIIAASIFRRELSTLQARETYSDDKGMKVKHKWSTIPNRKRKIKIQFAYASSAMTLVTLVRIVGRMVWEEAPHIIWLIIWLLILVFIAVICVGGLIKRANTSDAKGGLGLILPLITVGIGAVIGIRNPVSDLWYYSSTALILTSVVFSIIDIIKNYNRLALRRLPQFDKKGGDDRA